MILRKKKIFFYFFFLRVPPSVTGSFSFLIFFKHRGFADFAMTKGFSFSPVLLAVNKTVIRSLLVLRP
jgi:hypothetical protein